MRRDLERIARGELSAEDGRRALEAALLCETKPSDIYATLAAATWWMLTERRRDSELRLWHRAYRDAAHRLRQRDDSDAKEHATKLEALADQIRMSVQMEGKHTRTASPDAQAVIETLEENEGSVTSAQLEEATGLRPSAMYLVLLRLTLSGCIARDPDAVPAAYRRL